MSYNGYKNYETWCVSLWLDNDQGLYSKVTNKATEIVESDDSSEGALSDGGAGEMAQWLKDYVEEMAPDLDASMWADLLNAALSEVDWYELGQLYVDNAREELER